MPQLLKYIRRSGFRDGAASGHRKTDNSGRHTEESPRRGTDQDAFDGKCPAQVGLCLMGVSSVADGILCLFGIIWVDDDDESWPPLLVRDRSESRLFSGKSGPSRRGDPIWLGSQDCPCGLSENH